jgi:hypothetical protein
MNEIVNSDCCWSNEIEFLSFDCSIEDELNEEMKNLEKSCQRYTINKNSILQLIIKGTKRITIKTSGVKF